MRIDEANAFASRVEQRIFRIIRMKAGPARDRLLRAVGAGLMVGEQRGAELRHGLAAAETTESKLSGLWFPTQFPPAMTEEGSRRILEKEPDGIALEVASAAKALFRVLGAVDAQLDAAAAPARKGRRS